MKNFGDRLKSNEECEIRNEELTSRQQFLTPNSKFLIAVSRPSLPTVKKIAAALNVQPALLLGNLI